MGTEEVIERLKLKELSRDKEQRGKERIWKVQPSIATTSDGLFEGLVSTGVSVWQWQSTDNGLGLAIRSYQGTSPTTTQIGFFDPQLSTILHSMSLLHVQHLSFRIPRILLFPCHGSSSSVFQQAKYAIVILP